MLGLRQEVQGEAHLCGKKNIYIYMHTSSHQIFSFLILDTARAHAHTHTLRSDHIPMSNLGLYTHTCAYAAYIYLE